MAKFTVVTLGCPKNTVNSEQMIYLLEKAGHTACAAYSEAEFIVLNTCAFIDSAKAEAIENILELLKLKDDGTLKKLFVVGCLAEMYKKQLFEEFPDIDGISGCGSYGSIVSLVEEAFNSEEKPAHFADIDAPVTECGRTRLTAWYSAYVRIAEGCNNRCSYCVIPSLRGHFRSRSEDAIYDECVSLAAEGVKELNIIAQDITRFGEDTGTSLASLVRGLCRIEGVEWIRLHYLYPAGITDELIEVIKSESKVCKYLDIPIQHCNNKILKAMNRRGTKADILRLIAKLRTEIPGVVLRTSLIVGLPGETDEIFEELCDFVKEVRFERAGIFTYSAQEGTPAAAMEDQVPEDIAEKRRELLYELQDRIMTSYYDGLVGKTLRVLCEGYDRIAETSFGRSYADSPDIDGKIFFKANPRPRDGDFIDIKLTENYEGDLFGEPAVLFEEK